MAPWYHIAGLEGCTRIAVTTTGYTNGQQPITQQDEHHCSGGGSGRRNAGRRLPTGRSQA